MKIGIGYDAHKLTHNRDLILGGVTIPYDKGLEGHSDADVLTHAIMDSILGAANLGDIGSHFPDTSNEFKNISSMKLLNRVKNLIDEASYKVVNIDSVIVAQKPKLSVYYEDMKKNIAQQLCIDKSAVGIKATTTEHLGFEGEEKGISAQAIALLEKAC